MEQAMNVQVHISRDCEHDSIPAAEEFTRWSDVVIAASCDLKGALEISLRLVDEAEGRRLNKEYRDKDYATNVLSFPVQWPADMPIPEPRPLGDIVICPTVVEKEAAEQNKSAAAHWAHLYIHGLLHLLGYDHETEADAAEMEALEIVSLQKLGISNPYLVG
jgi:probable rRNA maturation factor